MKFYITSPQNCQSCRYKLSVPVPIDTYFRPKGYTFLKLSIYRPCSNLSHKDSFFDYTRKTYLSQTELKKTNTIRQYVKFNKLLKQANYYFLHLLPVKL